jgi:hypothetical protein
MSWTPYVGDPYSQVGETAASSIGPNYYPHSRFTRKAGMNSHQRMTTSIAGAVPWQQLSPDQAYFVNTQGSGRWANDAPWTGMTPAVHIRRHADGTCDMGPLTATASAHVDLGGHMGRDVAAARLF